MWDGEGPCCSWCRDPSILDQAPKGKKQTFDEAAQDRKSGNTGKRGKFVPKYTSWD